LDCDFLSYDAISCVVTNDLKKPIASIFKVEVNQAGVWVDYVKESGYLPASSLQTHRIAHCHHLENHNPNAYEMSDQ
jgi:hypothetical protein